MEGTTRVTYSSLFLVLGFYAFFDLDYHVGVVNNFLTHM